MWTIVLKSLLVYVGIAAAMQLPLIEQRGIQKRETNSCDNRQTPGHICESCELLSTCVRHSNGWVNIPVESCDTQNGYYCNARLGMCSNSTGPCHPFAIEGNFQCTSQGIYPDPYDCQKYHMCYFVGATLVAVTVDCGGDKAFDATLGQCALNIHDKVCLQRQYTCPSVGYVAAWPSNPNIFYVCKSTVKESQDDTIVLYPSLHRCADGEIFDNFYCRGGNNSSAPWPTQAPNVDDPGFTVRPTNQPTSCTKYGLLPDANDCHKYFYCSVLNGAPKHLQCPQGTYYNPTMAACTLGSC